MPSIFFKGTKAFYTISGQGPVIVWLHGFLESAAIWNNQVTFFNSSFTNICVDLLGHGKTGVVSKIHSPLLQAVLVYEVLQYLKIEQCTIIGHSMGGYVALAFAEKYSDKLNGIVLMNSTSNADTAIKKQNRKRALKIVETQKEVYTRLGVVNLFSESSRGSLKNEIDQIVSIAQNTTIDGIKAALMGMMHRPARTEILKNFEGKKIIISGVNDPLILANSSREEAFETDAIFFQVKGGHMSYVEAKNVNLILKNTLTKQ